MAIRLDDVDLDRDRALVQRFQAGDRAAFDELYGRYRRRLERFCLKRIGDHHAAEEVAQEAFTRALAALPALGGERRFYPWVSVIASRLCVDFHRTQARSESVAAIDVRGVPGGQEAIVDAVDVQLVATAMSRLGPRHQDVLRLREVEGWSYRRIADHYGVPIGTIETLLFRARRALRREFDIVDGAGLAAIPFIGWLIRGLARTRDRVIPVASLSSAQTGLAAAAAATAAAVAIAVSHGGLATNPGTTERHVAAGPAQAPAAPKTAPVATGPAPGAAVAAPAPQVVPATTAVAARPLAGGAASPVAPGPATPSPPAIGLISPPPLVPVNRVPGPAVDPPPIAPSVSVTPLPIVNGRVPSVPAVEQLPVGGLTGQLAGGPGSGVPELPQVPPVVDSVVKNLKL